jgi:hypothetical protein
MKKRDITLVKVRSTVALLPLRDISSYLVDNLGIHLVCRYITTAGNGCQTFFSLPAYRFVRIYSPPAMDKYRPIMRQYTLHVISYIVRITKLAPLRL